jgi:hypothetical protein
VKESGVAGAADTLTVSPNVAAELARQGISSADITRAGVAIASESPVGAAVAATRVADTLRAFGGPGARSAAADGLNIAEAAAMGANVFVTADKQILDAFAGTTKVPGTDGVEILFEGF